MRPVRLLLLSGSLLLSLSSATAQPTAAPTHPELRLTAEAAYQRKDYAAARDAYAAALVLRPDSPRYLHNLAATQALTGHADEALATLRRLTALGIATAVERDSDFASLQGSPAFNAIRSALAANRESRGQADLFAELPGRTGIIEGLAHRDRTGELFLADVHHRCIWRRDHDGRVTRYTAEDEDILGVFALAVDEPRRALWAATSGVPEMTGFTKEHRGQAALLEFNLANSELRRVIEIPDDGREHVLGDLVVTPDGVVYATDSAAPIIWRFSPGDEEPEKLIESASFGSLQGLVLSGKTLLVSDYTNGLFALDLAASPPTLRALVPPPNTTLLGLDGLVAAPGGLFGVQNGVTPQRLVHVALSPDLTKITAVTVLASGLPHLEDLALITLVHGRPTFIANSGWETFVPTKTAHPPAHTVRIFQVAVP